MAAHGIKGHWETQLLMSLLQEGKTPSVPTAAAIDEAATATAATVDASAAAAAAAFAAAAAAAAATQRCSMGSLGREIPGNFSFPGKRAGNS